MSTSPLVSVIIPMYNAENYIQETITSVLTQTVQDFEILVINDGSKDESKQRVEEFQKKDARIKLIDKVNTGVSDTRNKGIDIARGKYLAFLDADDTWEQRNLEEKLNAMHLHSKEWAYSNLNFMDSKSKLLPMEEEIIANDFYKNLLIWKIVVPGPCSNIVVSAKLLGSNMRFDTRLSSPADRDICIQLARQAEPVFIDKKLWNYRQHDQSMTSINKKVVTEMEIMYNKYIKEGYFPDKQTKKLALSNVYFILAGICLRFTKETTKGVRFLFRSFLNSPANFFYKMIYKLK
jgi:glycosyltransferase involved in cell wall biosynthesis